MLSYLSLGLALCAQSTLVNGILLQESSSDDTATKKQSEYTNVYYSTGPEIATPDGTNLSSGGLIAWEV